MILTCPECATRYFVRDQDLGGAGRTVRCTSCGAAWRASADAPLDLVASEEEGAVARPPPEPAWEPSSSPAELPGEELPKVFRERVKARERTRKAAVAGAVWGLLAAGFVALLGSAAVFRVDVVRLWPNTASAYAAVGMPVNATGLVIEDERVDREFADGRPALIVRGTLRNVRGEPVPTPPLEVKLLNEKGRAVRTQIAKPEDSRIPTGADRRFMVSVLDPPASVTDVEVRFLVGRKAQRKADAAPKLRRAHSG